MIGLAAKNLEDTAVIEQAVQCLIDTPRHERHGAAVPLLKQRFGLSTGEAVSAVKEFALRMARAG
ncbi:hypothetical protein [Mesorhizobium sp. B4-1-4]|uniref:hypothetical protein n=1 Tax=Mesorhizobium sp. B4-1-4 TaxID=2589888 RepID=UPI0011279553|nr:hypothetical protein [Mesorhizobium sp. B4-1-4]UCI33218.1 hypothetical protein FJW03_07215 [Mesorhizobium sp. B4-1-4]